MDIEKVYEQYEKELNKLSNGLIKADKMEYLKMIALYQAIQQEQFKEMQKYYIKGTI